MKPIATKETPPHKNTQSKSAAAKLHQPHLVEDALQRIDSADALDDLLQTAIYEESAVESCCICGLTLTGLDGHSLSFRQIIFKNCRLLGCQFQKASFRETLFINCDLSSCDFRDSYWDCCTLQAVKATGANWTDSSLHHLHWQDCQLRYANFSQAILEAVQFIRCGLQESSLSACKRKKACSWTDCDLTHADFFQTPLKGLDFSNCQIDGLLLSDDYHELQGLTVNTLQAIELAKLLGVIIQ